MAHVLIVGAGPAGASLAHLLAHRGIEVTLLERQRDFAREFRGEILMPSGVEVFDQMGLADALATVPSYQFQNGAFFLGGRPVFRVELDDSGPSPVAVSQPGMLEMLVAEAAKSPHFHFERGASVSQLLEEDGRVVGARARTEEGERELRADLVIGADGRGSAVRKRAGLTARDLGTPMDIVWCKLPCPDDFRDVGFYIGGGHLLACYRTYDGSLQLGWVILKGTFGELRDRGIEQWVEEMAHHVSPELADHLRAHPDAAQHPFLLSTRADCVERWSAPGVLVIGDAAHTMSPVGGQGVNIALRDAIVAANHLVPALTSPTRGPAGLDGALRALEDERMREVRLLQRLQAQPPKILLSRSWWGEPVRRVIGALLGREAVRARAGGRANVFINGVTEVRLHV